MDNYTPVDGKELQVREAAGDSHYAKRLMDALGGDGRDWVFTGAVHDTGTAGGDICMCGTPIRYVFQIQNRITGEYGNLGSSCIVVFKSGNPDTYAKLKAAEKKLRKELSQLKKQAEAAHLEALVADHKAALADAVVDIQIRVANWRNALVAQYGQNVMNSAFYPLSPFYYEAITRTPPRYLKPAQYEAWYAGRAEKLAAFETAFTAAQAQDYKPRFRYQLTVGEQTLGADSVDDMWEAVRYHVLPAIKILNQQTQGKFEDRWKASTRLIMLAERGIITMLRTEESPDWWTTQPIKIKVEEYNEASNH